MTMIIKHDTIEVLSATSDQQDVAVPYSETAVVRPTRTKNHAFAATLTAEAAGGMAKLISSELHATTPDQTGSSKMAITVPPFTVDEVGEHSVLTPADVESVTVSIRALLTDPSLSQSAQKHVLLLATLIHRSVTQAVTSERDRRRSDTLSLTDSLTSIDNRAGYELKEALSFERCLDEGTNFAIIMLDLDKFKNVNDTMGHLCGDYVLKTFASLVSTYLQDNAPTAHFGRIGGEEFCIALPEIGLQKAAILAEGIRRMVEAFTFSHETLNFSVTTSVGVCELDGCKSPEEMRRRSDMALYKSKNSGRNRVTMWDQPDKNNLQLVPFVSHTLVGNAR